MKILVVGGAGAMASGTVRDLASPLHTRIREVVIADQSLERAEPRRANRRSAPAACSPDVREHDRLMALLRRPTSHQRGADAARPPVGDSKPAWRRANPMSTMAGSASSRSSRRSVYGWQQAGVAAVLGLGTDPGISNMLCKAVAERPTPSTASTSTERRRTWRPRARCWCRPTACAQCWRNM
jgi:hypothetical protein